MKCVYTAVETLYLLVTLFGIVKGGEECYGAEFSEDVWPCADFDNKHLTCEPLELGMVEGKDGELGLNGKIKVLKDIEEGTMVVRISNSRLLDKMNVEIWKIVDIGKEYLYHAQGDICSSLKDDKTPWYPMIDAMKIKDCPIAADTFNITDMSISLEHAKDMMTHELCGDYLVQLCMTQELNKMSCHELTINVSEKKCP